MTDITPKEASEILSSYTNLGYGIVIEGDDVSKIVQALSLARKALASGGDLISREALKTKAYTAVILEPDEKGIDYVKDKRYVVDLADIDNAPTVQAFTLEDMQNNFDAGVDSVIGKYDKAEGEWLEYNATGKKQYMCSECSMKEKNPKIARYCYWCGAKMKGGAE